MFGAIYVGLSGLNAYSRGLQQVSNNVANLNSTGFKAASVTFSDLYQLGGRGGRTLTDAGDGTGGGVTIGDTQRNMRQGELRQTDRDLDLAVDGTGFLVLKRGNDTFYTRTGSFEIDKDGYIVLAGTDYRLATIDGSGQAVSVSIDSSRTNPPQKTGTVRFAENLSSSATSHTISNVTVYDTTGTAHVWKLQFAKNASPAVGWTLTVTDGAGKTIGTETISFTGGIIDAATSRPEFTDSEAGLTVAFDMSNVTSFSGGDISTMRAASVDGHAAGTISGLKVNEKGRLEISYSNEQKTEVGAVAVADFRDPQALEQRSGGLFTDPGSADGVLASSGDPRVGTVLSRRLEASNVDLAQQFGDLILIQRGFQASSQIISVANDMIQQLFGIRGQG
jgi:flagellar hook protein FlgE